MTAAQNETDLTRIEAVNATGELRSVLQWARGQMQYARHAQVSKIPLQTDEDDAPPTAPVAALTDDLGIQSGLNALFAIDYDTHQHPMATRRCPGIICFDRDMSDTVARVNAAKRALHGAMQTFGYNGWRNWQHSIPTWSHLNRLQAYREWHWIDKPIRKVGLCWAGHTTNTEHLRVAALRARLSEQYDISHHPNIAVELDRLDEMDSNEVVVIRRPIAPTPMANVVFEDGSRCAFRTALPLLVVGDMPKVKLLNDFDINRGAKRSDQAAEDEPLVRYVHAYRLKAPYRFHLDHNPEPVRLTRDKGRLTVRYPRPRVSESIDLPSPPTCQYIAGADRGPVKAVIHLDAEKTLRLVALNRAYGFIQTPSMAWRVPTKDLRSLADKAL